MERRVRDRWRRRRWVAELIAKGGSGPVGAFVLSFGWKNESGTSGKDEHWVTELMAKGGNRD